jgi:hypothetical protein
LAWTREPVPRTTILQTLREMSAQWSSWSSSAQSGIRIAWTPHQTPRRCSSAAKQSRRSWMSENVAEDVSALPQPSCRRRVNLPRCSPTQRRLRNYAFETCPCSAVRDPCGGQCPLYEIATARGCVRLRLKTPGTRVSFVSESCERTQIRASRGAHAVFRSSSLVARARAGHRGCGSSLRASRGEARGWKRRDSGRHLHSRCPLCERRCQRMG